MPRPRVLWHAARTKSRQEQVALANLSRQGYAALLPTLTTLRRRRARAAAVTVPLFPGYVFVAVEPSQQSYAPIRSTLGVLDLVRFGDRIPTVPDEIIEALRQRQEADRERPPGYFEPGDDVMIVGGPLAGLKGVYQMDQGRDRVQVLLELLGRSVSTKIPRESVIPHSA